MHHPAAGLIVKEYLAPLKNHPIDTLLLGCTHYPLLEKLIRTEAGDNVAIVDSATTCAEEVASLLLQQGLSAKSKNLPDHAFYVSEDPKKFQSVGQEFLGFPIHRVASWPL
jgi:glutamate racemase